MSTVRSRNVTVWLLFECEKGNRWSNTEPDDNKDGGECWFSGCVGGEHRIRLVKTTTDLAEAHDWFHSIYRSHPK